MKNITAFINHKNYSLNTAEAYTRDLQLFFKQNKKNESEITRQDINHYISKCLSDKQNPNTINRKIASIKEYYKFLTAFEHIKNNPTLTISNLKTAQRLPVYLTENEVNTLINQAKTNTRHQLIIKLLYYTGLRVSELCNLKVNDIQDDKIVITGKGNKQRVIPVAKSIATELNHHLDNLTHTEYVFCSHRSLKRPITRDGVYRIINTIGAKCGISKEKLHPHAFRHTTATTLLNKGVDIRVIQEVLGHSSLSTTALYASVDMNNKQKAIDVL